MMEPLTIVAIVTLIVTEAAKESGKNLAKGAAAGFNNILKVIRDKFQQADAAEVLQEVKDQPTDENIVRFEKELEYFLKKDNDFVQQLAELVEQLQVQELSNLHEIISLSKLAEELINRAESNDWHSSSEEDFTSWLRDVRNLINKTSREYEDQLEAITYSPVAISSLTSDYAKEEAFKSGLQRVVDLLKSLIASLVTKEIRSNNRNILIIYEQEENFKSDVYQFIKLNGLGTGIEKG